MAIEAKTTEKFEPEIFLGYSVRVSLDPKNGFFQYTRGSKAEADALGKQIKAKKATHLRSGEQLFVVIKPVVLRYCRNGTCRELTEADERYCLKCNKTESDTREERYVQRGWVRKSRED